MADAINGDLSVRAVADTSRMDWAPSPSASVWRKRVHRVGPAESGQVTSVVRYDPDSEVPVHDHPDGEEILVLDGVFSRRARRLASRNVPAQSGRLSPRADFRIRAACCWSS